MTDQYTDFEERLDRVRRAAEVITALPSEELQSAAFAYVIGDVAAANTPPPGERISEVPVKATATVAEVAPPSDTPVRKTPKKNGSKSPKSVSHDREIDLFPEGKTSFKDFAAEKAPASSNERYAVAVYWILRVAELPSATVAQVMSCFMVADWRLPSDPVNAGSQSRKAGFLSSAKSEDLQLSSIGLNLVKSDLPRVKS